VSVARSAGAVTGAPAKPRRYAVLALFAVVPIGILVFVMFRGASDSATAPRSEINSSGSAPASDATLPIDAGIQASSRDAAVATVVEPAVIEPPVRSPKIRQRPHAASSPVLAPLPPKPPQTVPDAGVKSSGDVDIDFYPKKK
jgi:hypothetical protein